MQVFNVANVDSKAEYSALSIADVVGVNLPKLLNFVTLHQIWFILFHKYLHAFRPYEDRQANIRTIHVHYFAVR